MGLSDLGGNSPPYALLQLLIYLVILTTTGSRIPFTLGLSLLLGENSANEIPVLARIPLAQ